MSELVQAFQSEIWPIWQAGGWLMLALAALSMTIYYAVVEQWRDANRWPLGKLLLLDDKSLGSFSAMPPELSKALSAPGDDRECARVFDCLRRETLQRMDRRISFLAILVSVAPLTGLLGTVSGLLTTFRGLAVESGELAAGVSSGINEALVTTQTGLIIAIPAFAFIYALRRRRDEWAAAITHVESVALRRLRKEAA